MQKFTDEQMIEKPRLLDLFCGAGGAAKGYQRAGFYVVGVDIKPQPHYCGDEFYQADALTFPLEGYDAYHASPPCQLWTGLQDVTKKHTGRNHELIYEDLLTPIRERLLITGKPYVIENVIKCKPIKTMIILCGASLGLKNLSRHRLFESNVMMFQPKCRCRFEDRIFGVYGQLDGRVVFKRKEYRGVYAAKNIEHASQLMGIDWMDNGEIQEAIPPAYTEYIGKYLMEAVKDAAFHR